MASEDVRKIFENLVEVEIEIESIRLDPKNPRFGLSFLKITDEELIESDKKILDKIMDPQNNFEIPVLMQSISEIGFLPIDKIVVRKITSGERYIYVVVEGNRRVSAIKTLLTQDEERSIDLNDDIKDTMTSFKVLNYTGDKEDISWIIQGIRHISGIKEWGLYEQAKFVFDLVKDVNDVPQLEKITEVSNVYGFGRNNAFVLVRAFCAFKQFELDPVYGDQAKPEKFSYFIEAIKKPSVKDWLGWSKENIKFLDDNNLEKFYQLITPHDYGDEKPKLKIERALDVREFGKILQIDAETKEQLINELTSHSTSLIDVLRKIEQVDMNNLRDLVNEIENFKNFIDAIPNKFLRTQNSYQKLKEKIEILKTVIKEVFKQ